jgi:hypothetical protein
MTREFIVLRCRRFTGRRLRALSLPAQWLYQYLHFQSDLTWLGTLAVNVGKWAQAAPGLTAANIDKMLAELVEAELILMDSCTQELLITCFADSGPEVRNRNNLRGAARSLRCIESEALRAVVYETSPPLLRAAMDEAFQREAEAVVTPSEQGSDAIGTPSGHYVNVNVNVDADVTGVLRAFWQSRGWTAGDPNDEAVRQRVGDAAVMLARRLRHPLDDQLEKAGDELIQLAQDFPGWLPKHLADAIEHGTFR